ncbi:uncharacterized protein LOC133034485 [Cannabis sativa]|uniref:uncharacterized protein LOC133034485 n=1 Tax=Cannabis sativa TaxID=3483 RepID=UPI0029CA2E9A|nr:uncharacterized protein LOC133034485 [Cannabis sativa]
MDVINSALITLIPKIDQPQLVRDFRPISLCSVLYKLVSKAIAVRFKETLPSVISQNQSAFLPNRLITNNVLLAFELVHSLKNKKRGRMGYAALKLDMSKAFDRVEWFFLQAVMTKMGFDSKWVTLVMKCVSSATLTFNINGAIKGSVVPKRGLRQGDPISPYLFLICSEGLSALLKNEESLGNLKGLSIARGAPSVSHLLFADDSLLFCQATYASCHAIQHVLDYYHRASGQLLNTDKTVMSFSPNVTSVNKDQFHHVLGMPICELHEKYLGLPSYAGKDKKELFSGIKDRIWKLMNQWHVKLFSIGGREVLLKAVVQSIPTYAMSCFSLPKKFCNQLESMMANFWWGSSANNSKIHWKALLAKRAWRIFENPSTLLARVLKARYFKNGDFLSAAKGTLPSLTWQSICDGKELLNKGLRWKIGLGNMVRCGSDPWLPGNTTFTPYTYSGDPIFTVSHYISADRKWDTRILENHFGAIDIERILSIPLSSLPREDLLIWHHSYTGVYSVKSGYHLAASLETLDSHSPSSSNRQWWNRFWSLSLPKKVKIFAWRFINDALPTAVNLVLCHRAKAVWNKLNFQVSMVNIGNLKGHDIFAHLAAMHNDSDLERIICLMWCIWSERNKETHGSRAKPADVICSFSATYLEQYHNAQASVTALNQTDNRPPNSSDPHPTAHRIVAKWQPPGAGFYKLNTDATYDHEGKIVGVGALIRDHLGSVIAGFSKPLQGCYSAKEMEAVALYHSLQWALDHHFHLHNIETDSLLVANAVNNMSSAKFFYSFL